LWIEGGEPRQRIIQRDKVNFSNLWEGNLRIESQSGRSGSAFGR